MRHAWWVSLAAWSGMWVAAVFGGVEVPIPLYVAAGGLSGILLFVQRDEEPDGVKALADSIEDRERARLRREALEEFDPDHELREAEETLRRYSPEPDPSETQPLDHVHAQMARLLAENEAIRDSIENSPGRYEAAAVEQFRRNLREAKHLKELLDAHSYVENRLTFAEEQRSGFLSVNLGRLLDEADRTRLEEELRAVYRVPPAIFHLPDDDPTEGLPTRPEFSWRPRRDPGDPERRWRRPPEHPPRRLRGIS